MLFNLPRYQLQSLILLQDNSDRLCSTICCTYVQPQILPWIISSAYNDHIIHQHYNQQHWKTKEHYICFVFTCILIPSRWLLYSILCENSLAMLHVNKHLVAQFRIAPHVYISALSSWPTYDSLLFVLCVCVMFCYCYLCCTWLLWLVNAYY